MKKQPVIFSGSTINYKFANRSGCEFVPTGLKFSNIGKIDFLEIDATEYTQITFTGINDYYSQSLYVQVINSAGVASPKKELLLPTGQTDVIYNIPEAYRNKNITLRLTTNITTTILVTRAVLS